MPKNNLSEFEKQLEIREMMQQPPVSFKNACRELIATGGCRGDCCGAIPIERSVWAKHTDKQFVNSIAVGPPGSPLIWIISKDGSCPFLDREKFVCKIYEDRPWICRSFGNEHHESVMCPRLDKTGRKRTRSERREISRQTHRGWKETLQMAKRYRQAQTGGDGDD